MVRRLEEKNKQHNGGAGTLRLFVLNVLLPLRGPLHQGLPPVVGAALLLEQLDRSENGLRVAADVGAQRYKPEKNDHITRYRRDQKQEVQRVLEVGDQQKAHKKQPLDDECAEEGDFVVAFASLHPLERLAAHAVDMSSLCHVFLRKFPENVMNRTYRSHETYKSYCGRQFQDAEA